MTTVANGVPKKDGKSSKTKKTKSSIKKNGLKAQRQLPGQEDKSNKKILKLQREYVEARDARMALAETEKEKRELLFAAMKTEGIKIHRDPEDGTYAEFVDGETKVYVRKEKSEEE